MTAIAERTPATSAPDSATRHASMQMACDDLKEAIDQGEMGDIVAKHEALILHYYRDVQDQAKDSFKAASTVARIGFFVLIGAVAYALVLDALSRFGLVPASMGETSFTVARIGIVTGAVIEFIAGITFWLYARVAKQFGAFHICLERTHRYLLAYTIADQMTRDKDVALRDIACIMAHAPMITRADVDALGSKDTAAENAQLKAAATALTA
jgi:hypothetical protein